MYLRRLVAGCRVQASDEEHDGDTEQPERDDEVAGEDDLTAIAQGNRASRRTKANVK